MTIRKAITFRASSIGDALLAKYLLENIRAAYPDARLGLVVAGRGSMIRDLLADYPWIEVIEANRRDLGGLWTLWKTYRGSDLVVLPGVKLGGSFGFASKLAGRILARTGGFIGFTDASWWNAFVYDRLLPFDPVRAPRLLEQDALRAGGVPISISAMTFTYQPQPHLLPRLGLTGKRYLVLHLFAGSENRGMSSAMRQALIDALAQKLPDVPLVLTGTKAERASVERLELPENAHVVAGNLSVQELAALIDGSACMVSIGTGPSHMASSLGTPLLVLVSCIGVHWCGREQWGDKEAARIFSDIKACSSGHDSRRPFPACIEGIDSEAVAREAARYFPE